MGSMNTFTSITWWSQTHYDGIFVEVKMNDMIESWIWWTFIDQNTFREDAFVRSLTKYLVSEGLHVNHSS